MISYKAVLPKPYTRGGVRHAPTSVNGESFSAEVTPGVSIRIYGHTRGWKAGEAINVAFDRTSKIGDVVVYGSYNLSYTGPITAIGRNTVTVDAKGTGEGVKRLDLHTFCDLNHDLDLPELTRRNAETMQCI